uniref:Uncharacterized protein n=1 Tax=Anguilla anguilla TaxID=7936 RepID=A0A0E9VCJ8_ANGAN
MRARKRRKNRMPMLAPTSFVMIRRRRRMLTSLSL